MERERDESRSAGSESLKKYLKEISRLPRITVQEERELGARIQKGDAQALRRLIDDDEAAKEYPLVVRRLRKLRRERREALARRLDTTVG